MRLFSKLLVALVVIVFAPCASVPAATRTTKPFVIAANPLAARAGLNVLRRGGSAVDAAIAVQAMLSLVEPQSSGVGGGAFMTYYDGRTGKISVYDGREVAPAQATSTMFLDASGKPLPFNTAMSALSPPRTRICPIRSTRAGSAPTCSIGSPSRSSLCRR